MESVYDFYLQMWSFKGYFVTNYFNILEGMNGKQQINPYSMQLRNVYTTIVTASGIVIVDAKPIFRKF